MSPGGGRSRSLRAAVLSLIFASGFLFAYAATNPLQAQFGRNKLQHQVFDFRIITTAHFDVYYYPEEEKAALDAARMAERSYARLSRILGHGFESRKPIILYASHGQFQQTNVLSGFISEGTGGVTEYAKRRVVLPFTGSYADFEHVLTHELVHAFQFDVMSRGIAGQFNPFAAALPLWFMEGMAEYLSIGEVDAHTHAWVRDAVLSGYLRTIDEMSARDDFLSYRFGQSLWAFIGAKYGDETVGLLLQRSMRLGLDLAFETTLGITLDQLSDDWIESVRTRYLPDAARYSVPAQNATRLTDHAFFGRGEEFASYLAPALSPDGEHVVFISDRGGDLYSFFDLWLASAEDGEIETRLVETGRSADFESIRFLNASAAWSPDGRRLVFAAKDGGRDALYVMDVESRRIAAKLDVELDAILNPTFSPDGERIAFTGMMGGVSDLYVVDVNGENFQQLTDDRYADLHPAWSPDGRFIALATDRGDATDFAELVYGNLRIALYSVGLGDIEILPQQVEGKNTNPVWSPDGQALAFISDRSGVNNIYIHDLSEDRLYQITDLMSGVTGITPLSPALTWAAHRDRLAFAYFEGAGYNIYVLDDPRRLGRRLEDQTAPEMVAGTPGEPAETSPAGEAMLGATNGGDGQAATGVSGRSQSFYRVTRGFRPSGLRPAEHEVVREGEVTIAQLLADADGGLPDTAEFERRDYELEMSPDVVGQPVIGGQVGGDFGAGVFGGSYILLSDMLGNHNALLSGQVAGSLNDAYLLAQYAYTRERVNLGMSYRQFPLYRFRGTIVGEDGFSTFAEERFVRDVYRSLSTRAHYPFNTFQRLELELSGVFLSRDSIVDRFTVNPGVTQAERTAERVQNLVFVGPSVALVWDNALFGYTGPIAGGRYRAQVGRFFGDVELTNVLLDLRRYFNLGGSWLVASRALGLWRSGLDEDEFRVYWGGPYYLRGYDGGSFNTSECATSSATVREGPSTACPVRDQLIGSSFFMLSNELRIPIFDFFDLGFVALAMPPLDAALFFDVGVAFNGLDQLAWSRGPGADPVRLRKPLASWGVGLRMNILFAILRLDYALPLDRPHRSGGVWSFSFGPSF